MDIFSSNFLYNNTSPYNNFPSNDEYSDTTTFIDLSSLHMTTDCFANSEKTHLGPSSYQFTGAGIPKKSSLVTTLKPKLSKNPLSVKCSGQSTKVSRRQTKSAMKVAVSENPLISALRKVNPQLAPDPDPLFLQRSHWIADSQPVSAIQKGGTERTCRPNVTVSTSIKGSASSEMKRICSHCQVDKTPSWREGPLGKATLCNACGIRWMQGKLFPEYRPANSPTFVSHLHSNRRSEVMELRKARQSSSDGSATTTSSRTLTQVTADDHDVFKEKLSRQISLGYANPKTSTAFAEDICSSSGNPFVNPPAHQVIPRKCRTNNIRNPKPQLPIIPALSQNQEISEKPTRRKAKKVLCSCCVETAVTVKQKKRKKPSPAQIYGASGESTKTKRQKKKSESNPNISSSEKLSPELDSEPEPELLQQIHCVPSDSVQEVCVKERPCNLDGVVDVPISFDPEFNYETAFHLRKSVTTLRCSHCQTQKTACWREGPSGEKVLCNACGLRWINSKKVVPKCGPGTPSAVCRQSNMLHEVLGIGEARRSSTDGLVAKHKEFVEAPTENSGYTQPHSKQVEEGDENPKGSPLSVENLFDSWNLVPVTYPAICMTARAIPLESLNAQLKKNQSHMNSGKPGSPKGESNNHMKSLTDQQTNQNPSISVLEKFSSDFDTDKHSDSSLACQPQSSVADNELFKVDFSGKTVLAPVCVEKVEMSVPSSLPHGCLNKPPH